VVILPQLSGVARKRLQIGTDKLFIINFCNLLLQYKIQEWTAIKKLKTDWQFAKRNCY